MNREGLKTRIALVTVATLLAWAATAQETRSLAGKWDFRRDDQKIGESAKWFASGLGGSQTIKLPGTMDEARLGLPNPDPPSLAGPYRPNIYEGVAWYERQIEIPESWRGRRITLFLERVRWVSRVWLDGQPVGEAQYSLIAPHIHELGANVSPGKHRLTLCLDNSPKINLGIFVSALYGGTTGNLNGVVGRIELQATAPVWVNDLQVYPDRERKSVRIRAKLGNSTGRAGAGKLVAVVSKGAMQASRTEGEIRWLGDGGVAQFEVALSDTVRPWDEFSPNLYTLSLSLETGGVRDEQRLEFGFRDFAARGTQFTMNGRPLYLRGTLECQVFPLTGVPPCDTAWWRDVCRVIKSYGLNFLRFHSWCPPEAAFQAADLEGVMFQVEAPQANVKAGEDPARDAFTEAELLRMIRVYGNHPSFCLMTLGNEYGGKDALLTKWVEMLIREDPRHLYSSASCAQRTQNRQFTEDTFGRGVHSEGTLHDVRGAIAQEDRPSIGHEIGQWVVYPNFEEIKKYTGVFQARHFELIREDLKKHGMLDQAQEFFKATGYQSALLYKEEIELLLRTRGFAGFSLLDLHDYPTQGTATIGMLDPFWDSKGFVTPAAHRRYCGPTVPLLRIAKRTYASDETVAGTVEVAHFGPRDLKNTQATWQLTDLRGHRIASGTLPRQDLQTGRLTALGEFAAPLSKAPAPCKLKVAVALKGTDFSNDWDIWVYPPDPAPQPPIDVLVSHAWDEQAKAALAAGGKVLIFAGKNTRDSLRGRFLPVFWSPVWFPSQVPNTMGILCDPKHPLLSMFPTEYYSNWQWCDLINHSHSLVLDDTPAEFRPLVQVIDNFARNHKLGNVFETRVGPGRLLVCSLDLSGELKDRPAARQFARGLYAYVGSDAFKPAHDLGVAALDRVLASRPPTTLSTLGAKVVRADSQASDSPGALAIDGNPDTCWHTAWVSVSPPPPHELVIDQGRQVSLAGVNYLPRQDMANGRIADFEIYVSDDGTTWGPPSARGRWPNSRKAQEVRFEAPVSGRFLKLVAKSEVNGHPWTSVAELDVVLAKP